MWRGQDRPWQEKVCRLKFLDFPPFEFLSHYCRHAATPGDQREWWVREGDTVRGLTANKRIGRERETIPAVREKKNRWALVRDKGSQTPGGLGGRRYIHYMWSPLNLSINRCVIFTCGGLYFPYTPFLNSLFIKNPPLSYSLPPLHLFNPHLPFPLLFFPPEAIFSSHPPTSFVWTLLHCLKSCMLIPPSNFFSPQTIKHPPLLLPLLFPLLSSLLLSSEHYAVIGAGSLETSSSVCVKLTGRARWLLLSFYKWAGLEEERKKNEVEGRRERSRCLLCCHLLCWETCPLSHKNTQRHHSLLHDWFKISFDIIPRKWDKRKKKKEICRKKCYVIY